MIGTMKYLENVTTLKLNKELCNGCKMCLTVCPHAVFSFSDKKATITDINRCMECGACALNCKQKAISVKSGVGCAAGILNGLLNNSEASCGTCDEKKAVCC